MCRIPLLVAFIACLLLYTPLIAQQNVEDTAAATRARPRLDSITKFEDLDMPPEMMQELDHLSPKGVLLYHDEFQGTHDGVFGLAIRTIKVWYIDDHIIGYSIEKPIDPGPRGSSATRRQKINIPVTWCCVPATGGHDEHCVNSLAALKGTDTTYKCSGWHLKIPDAYNDMLEQQTAARLRKLKPQRAPNTGDFGKAPKTDNKSNRKKKGKPQNAFEENNETPAAADSTQQKPAKDSL